MRTLPSTFSSCRTSDALPLRALGLRPPLVLHEQRTGNPATALSASSEFRCIALSRPLFVVQDGVSNRSATSVLVSGDRPTPIAITPPARTSRAAVETLETVTESGVNSSLPASKAIVTFLRPWFTRQPANKGRAGLSVSTVVGSDGLIAYRFMEIAYRLTRQQLNPLPGAGALLHRRGTPTPIDIMFPSDK